MKISGKYADLDTLLRTRGLGFHSGGFYGGGFGFGASSIGAAASAAATSDLYGRAHTALDTEMDEYTDVLESTDVSIDSDGGGCDGGGCGGGGD